MSEHPAAGPRYASTTAFLAALTVKVNASARTRGVTATTLRRQYLLERFLARVFTDPEGGWVLKGGTGLLMRLPVARYSRDLDLAHTHTALPQALHALRQLCTAVPAPALDPFTFTMGEATLMRGGVLGARVPITGWVGAVEFGRFPLDLSTELHPVGAAEQHAPNPVVAIDDVAPLPPMTVYPLCDQVADKVCAMNAHYSGGAVSTRYRDLVDLVLIVTQCALDAALTASALAAESHRRTLVLPTALTAPAPSWAAGYRTAGRDVALTATARTLATALHTVGTCLNPLLDTSITRGTWQPTKHRWHTP